MRYIEDTEGGLFVARREGVCIKLSVPACTSNDWKLDKEFMDLPLMDEDTFNNFVSTINALSKRIEW